MVQRHQTMSSDYGSYIQVKVRMSQHLYNCTFLYIQQEDNMK